MKIYDLTTDNSETAVSDQIRELNSIEKEKLTGGAAAFLKGKVVRKYAATAKLTTGGGKTAKFPVSISNARFTQSGTTLCKWHKCTVYISGC